MSDWLDLELAHELRPAPAPDGLWARVESARRQRAAPKGWNALRVPAVSLMALVISVVAISSIRKAPRLEQLAAHELTRETALGLRSSDGSEIAAWLRHQTGLEVAIPQAAKGMDTGRVRLKGARVIRERGAVIGAVAYQVGDASALLLVAHAGGPFHAAAKHGGLTWQHDSQIYAIAADQPQLACALCHANI